MRLTARMLVMSGLLAALTACEPVSLRTTTTTDVLAPPDGVGNAPGSTSGADSEAPPVTADPSPYSYEGNLPDGTDFHARVPGLRPESMLVVAGDFSYVFDEDTKVAVGEVRYVPSADDREVGFDDGILVLTSEDWLVEVHFSEEVLDKLGEQAVEVITRSVGLEIRRGLPVLALAYPFTWVGGSAQIRYETFAVASGCYETAVRCTDNRAVQILNVEGAGLSDSRIQGLSLETATLRPVNDPFYLNPGPLSERLAASLVWTGNEMIVWGGKTERDGIPSLTDGAAFDPATNRWRMLPSIPGIEGRHPSRAIWAEDEMVVVSSDGTFGYDAGADSWRTIGNGVVPSEWHDRMVYLDGRIYVWARSSQIHELTIATGEWRLIDGPIASTSLDSSYFGVLRAMGGRLMAVTLSGTSCSGKGFWLLDDEAWLPVPEVSLATETYADCSTANQVATLGDGLVIWDEDQHPSAGYSHGDGAWRDLPPIPLGGSEGPPGPVPMGPTHFLVPRWGEAAIFDAAAETWFEVELPGAGTDAEIVWTGAELLAWGIWESFDAWRWTPPEGLVGGDDAS